MLTAILFFLSIFVCIYLAIKKDKIYLFFLYELIYFFSPQTKWWWYSIPQISYSFYTVLTMIIVFILDKNKFGINNPFKIRAFWCFYIVVFLFFTVSWVSPYPQAHAIAFEALLTLAVLITLVYSLAQSKDSIHIILHGYLIGAFYLSFYIFQFGRNSGDRVEGVGMPDAPDANGIAAAIAPSLLITAGYFWNSPNWRYKIVYGLIGVFITNAIILINSRGAFLGVLAGGLYMIKTLYFGNKQHSFKSSAKNRAYLLSLLLVAGLGASLVVDESFINRMMSIKSEAKVEDRSQESGSTRVEFWKAAIRMSVDYPFGLGAGGFQTQAPFYIPDDVDTGATRNRATHSMWFEVLTNIGYLGFISFVLMLLLTYQMLIAAMKSVISSGDTKTYVMVLSVLSAFISFLVTATFLNRMRAEVLYWLIVFSAIMYKYYFLRVKVK